MFKILLLIGFCCFLCYALIGAIIEQLKKRREFNEKVKNLTIQLDEIDWDEAERQWSKAKEDYKETTQKIEDYKLQSKTAIYPGGKFLDKL